MICHAFGIISGQGVDLCPVLQQYEYKKRLARPFRPSPLFSSSPTIMPPCSAFSAVHPTLAQRPSLARQVRRPRASLGVLQKATAEGLGLLSSAMAGASRASTSRFKDRQPPSQSLTILASLAPLAHQRQATSSTLRSPLLLLFSSKRHLRHPRRWASRRLWPFPCLTKAQQPPIRPAPPSLSLLLLLLVVVAAHS